MRRASAALIPVRGPQGPDKDSSNIVPGPESTYVLSREPCIVRLRLHLSLVTRDPVIELQRTSLRRHRGCRNDGEESERASRWRGKSGRGQPKRTGGRTTGGGKKRRRREIILIPRHAIPRRPQLQGAYLPGKHVPSSTDAAYLVPYLPINIHQGTPYKRLPSPARLHHTIPDSPAITPNSPSSPLQPPGHPTAFPVQEGPSREKTLV